MNNNTYMKPGRVAELLKNRALGMCSKVDQSTISKKRKMPESVWKPISSKKPRYINSDSSQKALNAGRYITFYSLRNGNLALRPNGLPFDLSYFDVPFHHGTIVSLKNN